MQLLHYTDAVIIPYNADSFSEVKQLLSFSPLIPLRSLSLIVSLFIPCSVLQSKKKILLNCVAQSLFTSSFTSIRLAFFWFRMTYSSLWSDFFPTTQ